MNKKVNKIEVIYPFGVHDLLTTTVATMFANFQEHLNGDEEIDYELKSKLITQFQKVFSNIQTMNHRGEYAETIDEIADRAFATQLDSNFKELVEMGNYEVSVTIEDMLGISLTPYDHIDIRRMTRNWGIEVNNQNNKTI